MDPEKILKGKKILVVDDEKDVLDFLSELLESSDVESGLIL
jgi:CheY-like chemotaxis protein